MTQEAAPSSAERCGSRRARQLSPERRRLRRAVQAARRLSEGRSRDMPVSRHRSMAVIAELTEAMAAVKAELEECGRKIRAGRQSRGALQCYRNTMGILDAKPSRGANRVARRKNSKTARNARKAIKTGGRKP